MKFFYETETTNVSLVKETLCQMANIFIDDTGEMLQYCDMCGYNGIYGITYKVCYHYPHGSFTSDEREIKTVCDDCLKEIKLTHEIIIKKNLIKN